MNVKKYILFIVMVFLAGLITGCKGSGDADSEAEAQEDDLDVKTMLFGHIGDSYEWHITDWGDKKIAIPLPVIVHSSTGWHCFSSSKIEEGEEYCGLYIAEGGKYDGKVVEDIDGEQVKPFNISITKNVLQLIINSCILLFLILFSANWYRRHNAMKETPKGLPGLIEWLVNSIYDGVIKESVGEEYKRYAPYLLTAFFFIFLSNLIGLVPFFPGGANLTGNIAVTLTLAMCTFVAVNFTKNKHYWKDIFWGDVPWWLKVPIPLMPVVEFFGMFTKPFALMVRLFANIMAGHCLILCIVAVVFMTAHMGAVMNGSFTVVAVLFGVFGSALELLVAFIQAYIFTILSSVFIGLSHAHPHEEAETEIEKQ